MTFAIGKQRITGLENRGLQAHRGQYVLHRAARLDMHMHISGRHQRQLASAGQFLQPGQPGRVIRSGMQLDGDPQAAGKTLGQPATFVAPLPLARHPEHQAIGKRTVGRDGIEVMAMQGVMPLVGASPGQRDEGGEVAVALAILGDENQLQAIQRRHLAADQQLEAGLTGGLVRPHDAGQRTFVSQGQGGVALGHCLLDQFIRVRRTAQETEIGEAMQLGIVGQQYPSLLQANRPCRNHPSALRKIHTHWPSGLRATK